MKSSKRNKKIVMIVTGLIVAAWTAYQKSNIPLDIKESVSINSEIIYTKHAKCRMSCRYLNKKEVMDVIKNGRVNNRKSNLKASPCPVLAKEKHTIDKQLARVVYADCPDKIKIITVIDLDTDHSCDCK